MFVKPLMLNEDQRKDVSEMFGKNNVMEFRGQINLVYN